MDEKFEEKIFEKYNKLFPAKDIREDETQSCLAWGFECGRGWEKLLEEFFEELDKVELPENFLINQIKSKFGTLRIYTSTYNEATHKLISKYEKIAEKTCEYCGHKNAKLRSGGWWVTLCDKCFEAKEEVRKKK